MAGDRIENLTRLLAKNPADTRLQFGLAMAYEKRGDWQQVADILRAYLAAAEDEGNAWGRLGNALRQLGRMDEARAAYQTGSSVALRHGHPSMAAEYDEILEDWD
jgi:E3 SUMO-protein ligase RanBP2